MGEIGKRISNNIDKCDCDDEVKSLLIELLEHESGCSEGRGIRWKSQYDTIIDKQLKKGDKTI